jgi:hypothetical protein
MRPGGRGNFGRSTAGGIARVMFSYVFGLGLTLLTRQVDTIKHPALIAWASTLPILAHGLSMNPRRTIPIRAMIHSDA